MKSKQVREYLLDEEKKPKVIHLNDGTHIRVRSREHWLAAPDVLLVLDERGHFHYIAYHNITSIVHWPANGHRRRPR